MERAPKDDKGKISKEVHITLRNHLHANKHLLLYFFPSHIIEQA